jgi:hypothetical protein
MRDQRAIRLPWENRHYFEPDLIRSVPDAMITNTIGNYDLWTFEQETDAVLFRLRWSDSHELHCAHNEGGSPTILLNVSDDEAEQIIDWAEQEDVFERSWLIQGLLYEVGLNPRSKTPAAQLDAFLAAAADKYGITVEVAG